MYLANPSTTAAWPYNKSNGATKNFMRYDFLSGFGTSVFRGIVVLLAMGVALQDVHWEYPTKEVTTYAFGKCGDNPSARFDPSCDRPTITLLDSRGDYITMDYCRPDCQSPDPGRRLANSGVQHDTRRLITVADPTRGQTQWGVDLSINYVKDGGLGGFAAHDPPTYTVYDPPLSVYCTLGSLTKTKVNRCVKGVIRVPGYWYMSNHTQHGGKDAGYDAPSYDGQSGYAFTPGDTPGGNPI